MVYEIKIVMSIEDHIKHKHATCRKEQITLVNKDFGPWGKMSVPDVFLDAEFKYVSRISLSPHFRSRSNGWNLLRQNTKVCFYRGRHEEFKDFFSQEDGVVFCNDVCSIMEVLGHEFNPNQWRLFIDSSKVCLKVVIPHNGNKFPSVPLAHAANMKEKLWKHEVTVGKD